MNADLLNRITIESSKCGGKPCVRGMRIRVSDLLEMLGEGVSMEEILKDFSDLEREDILLAFNSPPVAVTLFALPREILGGCNCRPC